LEPSEHIFLLILNRNHPDIPCLLHNQEESNCIGKEFGIADGDGLWYNPIRKFHGTHVAGTIGASGKNKYGIQGVINDGNICFIIGRVFGENGGGTRMSNIFEAIEWVADQGAKVINLSLGVDMYHSAGDSLMKAIYDEGSLIVAASGNGGTNASHYPANYMNVLSVAAVDANRDHAWFSQYNSGVDISAPGVDILSTQPMNLSGAIFLSAANISMTGMYFQNSNQLQEPITGTLEYCPSYGNDVCPGDGGHICLIERYVTCELPQ
jgi:serine protease